MKARIEVHLNDGKKLTFKSYKSYNDFIQQQGDSVRRITIFPAYGSSETFYRVKKGVFSK